MQRWGLYPDFHTAQDTILELRKSSKEIKKVWKNNLEKSLPQILNIFEILPKQLPDSSTWYYDSIEDIMEKMNIPSSEWYVWSSMYNKFGKKREKAVYSLLRDLSTNHIKRILNSKHLNLSSRNKLKLCSELDKRGIKLTK